MAQETYENFASYDWGNDEAFKAGLRIILGQNIPPDSPQAIALESKYKFFYFSKRFGAIDRDGFENWAKTKDATKDVCSKAREKGPNEPDLSRPWFQQIPSRTITEASTSAPDESEGKAPTFDEIVELIQSGKPIAGIRQIPDQLNSNTPSTSSVPARKKPWET